MINRISTQSFTNTDRRIIASDTAPSSAAEGDVWFDTANELLFMYSNSSWVKTGTNDPIRKPLSESNDGFGDGFPTGTTIHTTPSGYTDNVYLYGSGTTNELFTYDGLIGIPSTEGVNSAVRGIGVQSDGKFLLSGLFTSTYTATGNVIMNKVARFHANGYLDTSFADPNVNSTVYAVLPRSDGKILIGGAFTSVGGVARNRIALLHSNGDVDTSFDANPDNSVFRIKEQSDGKILVGGQFSSMAGNFASRVARFHANGDYDTSFADPSANGIVYDIDTQSDGKIVIGGTFSSVGGSLINKVARLHPNGSVDTSFADSNANSYVYGVGVQSDGKVYIGGSFSLVGGVTRNRLARLHANGALDTTFADPNLNSTVQKIDFLSDGKVVVVGQFSSYNGVAISMAALLDADGNRDTSFAPGLNSSVYAVEIQSNDHIVIAGAFTYVNGDTSYRWARINPFYGDKYNVKSKIYTTLGSNSMNAVVGDYELPSGYSIGSRGSGTFTGYVTREEN